ncbi:purine-binding chemotaxis protein CheW [Bacillus luteolus]|uniref:Purine-binding chemotaxis protein CheW n=1 Tax=Litchfieldia luteola TaxID=682179 RepID=A0ABR9QEL3_9BACI|nr:chemotaxis protein CheW [Cytobacillus luteolus]MBE4906936.1 purine-binding chemotaxis protein CheW [Cytobacillus luteolus]MBP1943601.1 purine-binding chemotaxis protein CheW [Cytobacillus luteolus]
MESFDHQNMLKVVVFKIGNEEYGLSIDQVVSIERMQQITTVPKTPDYVRGITTIRGLVTPVVDLRKVMNVDTHDSEYSRLIIVKIEEQSIGLVVDSATDVLDIPSETIQQPNLSTSDTDYLLGVSKLNNRLILLVHTEFLLKNLSSIQEIKELVTNHE